MISDFTIGDDIIHQDSQDMKFIEKARKWRQINGKKYSDKKSLGIVHAPKDDMPPEHLR